MLAALPVTPLYVSPPTGYVWAPRALSQSTKPMAPGVPSMQLSISVELLLNQRLLLRMLLSRVGRLGPILFASMTTDWKAPCVPDPATRMQPVIAAPAAMGLTPPGKYWCQSVAMPVKICWAMALVTFVRLAASSPSPTAFASLLAKKQKGTINGWLSVRPTDPAPQVFTVGGFATKSPRSLSIAGPAAPPSARLSPCVTLPGPLGPFNCPSELWTMVEPLTSAAPRVTGKQSRLEGAAPPARVFIRVL